jgi:hypothetical protein
MKQVMKLIFLDNDIKILILERCNIKINNLPVMLKEIWLSKNVKEYNIKIPFGTKVNYY